MDWNHFNNYGRRLWIILAKFDQNRASLYGVLQKQLLMTHERHYTITKAHLQPMAHMSLKVITNTAYKLEEVEDICLCRISIASNPLEKDYIQLIVTNWIEDSTNTSDCDIFWSYSLLTFLGLNCPYNVHTCFAT